MELRKPQVCADCQIEVMGTEVWFDSKPYHPQCGMVVTVRRIEALEKENYELNNEVIEFIKKNAILRAKLRVARKRAREAEKRLHQFQSAEMVAQPWGGHRGKA
jgi:cob(I)alamin adenosyltransferase